MEIVKCMSLYSEELIARDEMILLMEELFGRHHQDVFQRFKEYLADVIGPRNATPQRAFSLRDHATTRGPRVDQCVAAADPRHWLLNGIN